MYNAWSCRTFVRRAGLLALVLLAAAAPSAAQDRQTRYAIERAQNGVSGKIIGERGGDWSSVTFDETRTQTWRVSDRLTGVRGEGRYAPVGGAAARTFTYEAIVNHRNGSVQQVSYDFVGGRGEGWRGERRVPRWLVGSFDGRSPSNRRRAIVTVTVARSGEVSAVSNDGARDQGTYDNGRIRFNSWGTWDVTRERDGFRAASGRRTEMFTRTSPADDNYDDDWDGRDDTGRVPRWMQGTFRGMTDSGESELIIYADGTATARSLTRNQSFQGTYSGGQLRFDWGTFDVQRERDGIRTIEVNNRNNQTVYRRTDSNY